MRYQYIYSACIVNLFEMKCENLIYHVRNANPQREGGGRGLSFLIRSNELFNNECNTCIK